MGEIVEFLIRRADHDDWDARALAWDVCHPTSRPSKPLSGPKEEPRFEVAGTSFQFIYEMVGIQVVVEGGSLDRAEVMSVLEEVVARMGEATGTPGYVVDMDAFGDRPVSFEVRGDSPRPAGARPDERKRTHPRKPWWRFW